MRYGLSTYGRVKALLSGASNVVAELCLVALSIPRECFVQANLYQARSCSSLLRIRKFIARLTALSLAYAFLAAKRSF